MPVLLMGVGGAGPEWLLFLTPLVLVVITVRTYQWLQPWLQHRFRPWLHHMLFHHHDNLPTDTGMPDDEG